MITTNPVDMPILWNIMYNRITLTIHIYFFYIYKLLIEINNLDIYKLNCYYRNIMTIFIIIIF